MKKTKLFLLLVLFTIGALSNFAQVTTSSISGRVTDGKEALIGATVKATHEPSGTVYGVSTRLDGTYNLLNMRIGGPYRVEISYLGYKTKSFSDLYLTL